MLYYSMVHYNILSDYLLCNPPRAVFVCAAVVRIRSHTVPCCDQTSCASEHMMFSGSSLRRTDPHPGDACN